MRAYYVGFSVGGLNRTHPRRRQVLMAAKLCGCRRYCGDTRESVVPRRASSEAVTDVGGGIQVAAVLDPFGNRIGLIHNPHSIQNVR